jgi:hypothetical protein
MWTAPKIATMLQRLPQAPAWHPPTLPRPVYASPRTLSSGDRSGVANR